MNNDQQIFQKVKTGDYVVPIKEACEHNGEYSESYQIGFPIFDEAMKVGDEKQGGVRDGDLVIISGRPGEGKTSFAQAIIKNLAEDCMFSIFFSYEVMVDNVYAKFKLMGMGDDPIVVVPKKIITGNLKWVKEKIIEAQEKHLIKFAVIDHIDFLTPSNMKNSDQLRIVLKNITLELKSMAIELGIIIFLIAHTKKVPNHQDLELEDIGESSGMGQLADFAFSVIRGYENVDGMDIATDEGVIKMLKNRLTGKKPYMKFRMGENNHIEAI